MAARAATDRPPPSTGSYVAPQLSTQDVLLVSRISLPPNPTICYALLKSTSADAIELARRSILFRYAASPIQASILTSVYIGRDPHIYFFKLEKSSPSSADVFRDLSFDGLTIQEISSFSPPNASALFPDDNKRIHIVHFFDALRSRLIQDIVDSAPKKALLSQRHVKRFKTGFLMSQISSPSGWEYKAITRSLVFCHLQIHFSYTSDGIPSHLVIHPMLLSTPFLDISPSLPLPAGTPITLLPFGTPAYFLACYSGPTAGLTKQFHSVLQGLGAGEWNNSSASPVRSPAFIIGWIKVENKQGEDKGLTIIYPTKLCLSCLPLTSSRGFLDYIPDLPAPLQPSPQASRLHSSSESFLTSLHHTRQCSLVSSPTSEPFNPFRALTLSSNDLERVTVEVGEYIDAVARERERERERLKREREIGTASPKTTRILSTTPVTVATESKEQTMSSSSTMSSALPPVSLLPSPPGLSTPQPMPSATIQTFYPSPPQSDPTLVLPTEAKSAPSANTTQVTTERASESEGTLDSYDMDSTWPRPKDGYLDIDMDNLDFVMNDIGLDFNLDMGPMANTSSTGATITPFNGRDATTTATAGVAFEDAFTDDDFSFFDQPSRPDAPPRQSFNSHARFVRGTSTLLSPPLLGSAIGSRTSPPNSRDLADLHITQSYTPGGFMDDFTPRSLVDHIDSGPPGLLPSSLDPTPESHSVPSTPAVHLEFDSSPKRLVPISEGLSRTSTGLFEPIPFAAYHREADDKYAVGKFALPSPPPEVDLTDGISMTLPSSPSRFGSNGGWRFEYNAVTDPRIGLVRKLIGVKRKLPSVDSKSDNHPSKKVFWAIGQENWDRGEDLTHENEESDADSMEDGDDAGETDNTTPSRPTTPTPSYLPSGPSLLSAHFHHSHLLSLSVPLRPPGAGIRPLNLTSTNPISSVPTPVSPAATMGAASERSRSLEAAASAVAVEVVENPLWAESWKANVVGVGNMDGVWSTDIKAVQKLLECIPGLEAPLTVAELFGLQDLSNGKEIAAGSKPTLQPMEAPMISIGKGEAIIQVLPPALRFWEKLGLSPKGGRKNVTAFVVFEENSEKQPFMEKWLLGFRNTYQAKQYGDVTAGQSTACANNGFVPLRFDATFRKSLGTFISSLTAPTRPTTVIFLVLPITILSLSEPVLCQILSVSKKVLANYHAGQILFEFIPEQHIYTGLSRTSAYDSTLDILSASVYNRIQVPVDRLRPHRVATFDDNNLDIPFYFMAPSFTLARPMHNRVSFLRAAHTSLDVMDRYTLLHVAYHLTRRWIIACCIDQRGENYNLGVWLTHSPGEHEGETEHSDEEYVVKKVWDFAMQFARKTNVEWRVVFAKLGGLSLPEMEAWNAYLSLNILSSQEQTPLHHSLVCVIPDTPWLFLPSKPSLPNSIRSSPSSARHPVFFSDVSSTTYAIFPDVRLPISLSPSQSDLVSAQSFIPEPLFHPNVTSSPCLQSIQDANISPQPAKSPSSLSRPLCGTDRHAIPLLPRSSSILVRIPHLHDSTTASNTSMIHVHLLRTYHSASYLSTSSQPAILDDKQLLEDVTRNYHELSVLSKTRWRLDGIGGHRGLPFHLAAIDAMRMALDKDWDRSDCSIE